MKLLGRFWKWLAEGWSLSVEWGDAPPASPLWAVGQPIPAPGQVITWDPDILCTARPDGSIHLSVRR